MARFFLTIGLLTFLSTQAFADNAEMTRSLINQFNGHSCDYEFFGTCQKRAIGFLERVGINSHRNQDKLCVLWAAECLGFVKSPEVVPVLTQALKTEANIQTCDGVIPIRSKIIIALGRIGDKRAIAPLEEYIKSNAHEKLSAGAMRAGVSNCPLKPELKEPAIKALAAISSRSHNEATAE